jgi:hypothetical protein
MLSFYLLELLPVLLGQEAADRVANFTSLIAVPTSHASETKQLVKFQVGKSVIPSGYRTGLFVSDSAPFYDFTIENHNPSCLVPAGRSV